MILVDNITFLKSRFPQIWEKIKVKEEQSISTSLRIESTKTGVLTLAVETEKGWGYVHSKYDPISEAERFIGQLKDVESGKYTQVFFYGIGLGYHVEEFQKKYPDMPYVIYEPNLDILHRLFSSKLLTELLNNQLTHMYTQSEENEVGENLQHFVNHLKGEVLFVVHPSYERLFTEQTKRFVALFRDTIFNKRMYIHAGLEFAKRTAINSMKNLPKSMQNPNILHQKHDFGGKPAILVAAGPSLDFEYENLRYIKENGLAYIFSVGSAINSLIEKGIYPDAACSYDGSPENQIVFRKVVERGIDQIPLIYGSLVGYETVQNYPGNLLHFLIKRDFFAGLVLKRDDEEKLESVESVKTISTITLQLLYKLGFSPIILVGQNFSYLSDKWYAEGIDHAGALTDKQKESAITVLDVEGNQVYTNKGFNSMRMEMEHIISALPGIQVINTTKGGAHIGGTIYQPLETVIREQLTTKGVVNHKWITRMDCGYDHQYVVKKIEELKQELDKLGRVFATFHEIISEMNQFISTLNQNQLQKLFVRFDKAFDKMQDNKFYLYVIQPMNMLKFELLMKTIEEIRTYKDVISKAKRIAQEFSSYLEACEEDIKLIEPIYTEMQQSVKEIATNVS